VIFDEIVQEVRVRSAPEGVSTRIIAVDGPGGAGKTTVAQRLSMALGGAPIVHTDDFASWENPLDWWPELIEQALEPLAAGRSARYRPSSWGGDDREQIMVEPGEFVVLEGVSASREAFRPYLTYSIWVETPREQRLERGLERDGGDARAQWEEWMAGEDAYIERERPHERADAVLSGAGEAS
jgi:uridine kinase